MKYFLKKFGGITILALIELFFFFKTKPNNLEMFFLVWVVISLALLLYNIFNIKGDASMQGLGGNSETIYANLASAFLEKKYDCGESKKRSGGLFDSINLLYLFLLLINIIGYIIVMPK